MIPRQGNALVAALVLIGVFLFSRGVPPVNPLIQTMSTATDATAVLGFAAGMLCVAAGLPVVAQFVIVRQD